MTAQNTQQSQPVLRGQIRGAFFDGYTLADPARANTGRYKYFVVLQGDDHFSTHPMRAVVFINSHQPPFALTQTQMPLKNIKEMCTNDTEIIDHGYVDLSYVFPMPIEFIRNSEYVTTLTPDTIEKQLNKRLAVGMGILAPTLSPNRTRIQ